MALTRGHKCSKRVMSLRFKSEAVKEASSEMRHGVKIIHEERRNYYIIDQKAKKHVGKREGSADIKDHEKRAGERDAEGRHVAWVQGGHTRTSLNCFKFYLFFRLAILSSMLGETAFSFLNPQSSPPFTTSLRAKNS